MRAKLNDQQLQELNKAITACRRFGYEVIAWNPNVLVTSKGTEQDNRLLAELRSLGLEKREDADNAAANIVEFSFFRQDDQVTNFSNKSIIVRPLFERVVFLVLVALCVGFVALQRDQYKDLKYSVEMLGYFFIIVALVWFVFCGSKCFMWRLRFFDNGLSVKEWLSNKVVLFDDIENIKNIPGRQRFSEVIVITRKDKSKLYFSQLGFVFARKVRDAIKSRLAAYNGAKAL